MTQLLTPISASSVAELHAAAAAVTEAFPAGGFIGLTGPLGAGKTEFVRGAAAALGVPDEICSPTFVLEIIHRIPGSERTLHHWDLYRVGPGYSESELTDYEGDALKLVFIEWPEKAPWLKLDLLVAIDFADDLAQSRVITFSGLRAPEAAAAAEKRGV